MEDTMTTTVTVTSRQGIGYTGQLGAKAYVARITGSDRTYGLAREFFDADKVERDHFGRARYIRTYSWKLTEGLYERAAEGERWYVIVWRTRDGEMRIGRITDDRLDAMVRRMDAGDDYDTARLATRPPKTSQSETQAVAQ